jgi:MmpS family membrane protein
MGPVPAVDSALQRRLRPGPVALVAGLGVVLAVGLVSAVLVTHRTSPAQGTPAVLPVAGSAAPATHTPTPLVTHSVRYELSGGAALDITYVVDGSGIAQVAEADSPWAASVSLRAPAQGTQFYSLSARDGGQGTLTCRITVDGTVVAEQTVGVPDGVVRCSKTLG